MQKVYVIILNYKKWQDTAECLESLLCSSYKNFHAIVIDNYSENDSIDHLIEWANNDSLFSTFTTDFSGPAVKPVSYIHVHDKDIATTDFQKLPVITFIQNSENKGFARGLNATLALLKNEDAFIWLLNPDVTVEKNTLEELIHFTRLNQPKTIVGAVIRFYEQPEKIHLYGGGKINYLAATVALVNEPQEISRLDYIAGGCLFTHAETFYHLGLLPEDYFLYWEETDFCYHAKLNKYRLLVCERAVCYDKISTSIGKSYLSDYYYTRNGLLFLSKYKKSNVMPAIFFTLFRIVKRIITGKTDRARGMFAGMRSFIKGKSHAIQ